MPLVFGDGVVRMTKGAQLIANVLKEAEIVLWDASLYIEVTRGAECLVGSQWSRTCLPPQAQFWTWTKDLHIKDHNLPPDVPPEVNLVAALFVPAKHITEKLGLFVMFVETDYGTWGVPTPAIDPSKPIQQSEFQVAAALHFLENPIVELTPALRRYERRQYERQHKAEPPKISLINLRRVRRPTSTAATATEAKQVNWTCRWKVHTHWRKQWYPSISMHRPKLIVEYEKGPEDKPFRETDRVYRVRR
jgi:hypothetical protein